MGHWRRHAVALLVTCAFARLCNASGLDREGNFNIPAQPLSPALIAFSHQADVQVITRSEEVSRERTAGVSGHMAIREALQQLLNGTHFVYVLVGESTVEIVTATITAQSPGANAGS